LDKNISILKDKEKELEKHIERLSEQQPLDVDEAVTTTAPLYKQYVTLTIFTVILVEVYM
jgi:ESCRT-I complex subunit TSG101